MALPVPNNVETSKQGKFREEGLRVTLSRFKATRKGVLAKPLHFQVPPLDEFAWTQSAEHQDFSTISKGQFSRRGGPTLLSFDLRTLVVDYQPNWAAYHRARPNAPHPQRMVVQLKRIVQTGTPVMFHARSGFWEGSDLRLPVTIRSVQAAERAGEVDARYIDLSFMEWREQELDRKEKGKRRDRHSLPTTVVIQKDGNVVEAGEPNAVEAGSLAISRGFFVSADEATLAKLASHFYGDPTLWRPIARENGVANFAPNRPLSQMKKRGKSVRKLRIPRLVDPRTGGVEAPA